MPLNITMEVNEAFREPGLIQQEFLIDKRLNFVMGSNVVPDIEDDRLPYKYLRTVVGSDKIGQFLESHSHDLRHVEQVVIIFHITNTINVLDNVEEDDLKCLVRFLFKYKLFFLAHTNCLDFRLCDGNCVDQYKLDILFSFPYLKRISFNNMNLLTTDFSKLTLFNRIDEIKFNKVKLNHWSTLVFPKSLKRLIIIMEAPEPTYTNYSFMNYCYYSRNSTDYKYKEIQNLIIPNGLEYLRLDIPHLADSTLSKLLTPITKLSKLAIRGAKIKFLRGQILPANLMDLTIENNELELSTDTNWPKSLLNFRYIPLMK